MTVPEVAKSTKEGLRATLADLTALHGAPGFEQPLVQYFQRRVAGLADRVDTDRYGNVHVPLGKVSFTPQALLDNFRAVLDELQRAKPAAAKGRYLKRITVSSTMGPGVKIDPARLRTVDETAA